MSKKTLTIIFLVSVVFNLAFIGTFFYLRFLSPVPPHRIPPERLIPAEYREKYFTQRKLLEPYHQELRKQRRNFLESLMQNDFDEKKSLEKLQLSLEKQKQVEKKLGEYLIQMRKSMTADQIKKYLQLRRPRRLENARDLPTQRFPKTNNKNNLNRRNK